jgi:hypothetical protein
LLGAGRICASCTSLFGKVHLQTFSAWPRANDGAGAPARLLRHGHAALPYAQQRLKSPRPTRGGSLDGTALSANVDESFGRRHEGRCGFACAGCLRTRVFFACAWSLRKRTGAAVPVIAVGRCSSLAAGHSLGSFAAAEAHQFPGLCRAQVGATRSTQSRRDCERILSMAVRARASEAMARRAMQPSEKGAFSLELTRARGACVAGWRL